MQTANNRNKMTTSKTRKLSMTFLLNIRGMQPGIKNQKWKRHDIEQRVEELGAKQDLPFFVLTETHLKSYVKDAEIAIEGYSMIRADRPVRPQGGVAICYKQHLSAVESRSFSNKTCEVCISQIVQLNVTIVAVYRPPDTTKVLFKEALTEIERYLTDISKQKSDLLIMGDLNFPNVNWDTKTAKSGCSKNDKDCFSDLCKVMEDHFLIQVIDKPTRKDNLLDIVLTNSSDLVKRVTTEDTVMSDHRLVMCQLGYRELEKVEEDIARTGFNALNLHKADWEKINSELSTVEWKELLAGPSNPVKDGTSEIKSNFEIFTEECLRVCEGNAPARHRASKAKKKRKNNNRQLLRRRKRKVKAIERLEEQDPNAAKLATLKGELVDIELEIRDKIHSNLKDEEANVIDQIKDNPKAFYSYANSFQKAKQNIGPLEDPVSKELKNGPREMADILQNQYVKVFSDPNTAIPRKLLNKSQPKARICDIDFSAKEIEEAIDELQLHSASGPDDFPAIVLKRCKATLAAPLYQLWRSSLDSGIIPQYLVSQKIVPVFKKGSKTEAQNYRPVSLTSHVIKIFERVMRKFLVHWLEANNLLSKHQHGFRKSKSCVTQLLAHIDSILNMLMEGANADVIYLDFAKAFDKVSHKILLKKLENLGIGGKILTWLKSFLSNRFQSVSVEGKLSFIHLVLSGVPQGTVLGPLLFIIFIDDIYESVKYSLARSFADDTRLTKAIKSIIDQLQLQEDLDAVVEWADENGMELHEGKFELLQHGKIVELKGPSGYSYKLSSGQIIANSSKVKDLGITVDESLGWTTHIAEVSKQASQMSAWVLRTFTTRQQFPLMTLYKSLIRSKLDYCCPVWSPIRKADICSLEAIQRSFTARIITLKGLTYWERLRSMKLMSVQRRRERYIVLHMWKIYCGIVPNDVGVEFYSNDRLGPMCRVPKLRAKSMQVNTMVYHSFGSMGPMLFNAVPKLVKSSISPESFKASLDDFLMTLPDTPPTPGYVAANNNSLLDWTATNDRALPEVPI